jgi:hypothetical protein
VEQPKPRTRLVPAMGGGTQRLDADVTKLMFNRYRSCRMQTCWKNLKTS